MTNIKVGDPVLVTGTAVDVIDGVGVVVRMFGRSDQHEIWIREDDVARAPMPDVPDEPGDQAWVLGILDDESPGVWHRDDANAPDEPKRRHRRRWLDVSGSEWVDWPTAVARGADPTRRLVEDRPTADPRAGERAVMDAITRAGASGVTLKCLQTMPICDDELQRVLESLAVACKIYGSASIGPDKATARYYDATLMPTTVEGTP